MPFTYKDPDTGETKEFTYDVGPEPDNEFTSAAQPPVALGTVSVEDTTGWDINRKTRRTLGQYLNRITHGQEGTSKLGNEFGIDANQKTLEITNPNGYPKSPSVQHTDQQQNAEGYCNKIRNIPELGYSSTSDDYSDAVNKNNFAIHKGVFKSGTAKIAASQNGNNLLKSVDIDKNDQISQQPEESFVVTKYVSSVLTKNRFTANNRAVDQGDEISVKMGTELGKNNLKDDSNVYSQQRLANVGVLLSLRSSGEWGSGDNGVDPTGGTIEAKAILPSFPQLGMERINPNEFSVKQIVSTLTTHEDVKEIDPSALSWGTMNNVHDQYFGAGTLGMQVLALSTLVSVLTIMEVFSMLFSLLSTPGVDKVDKNNRPYLGSFMKYKTDSEPGGFLPKLGPELLGLNPTENNLRDAVEEGMKAFYGLEEISLSALAQRAASTALSSLTPSQDVPGLQIAVSRTIIRSSLALKDAFSNIGGNPLSVIKGVLGIIEVIKKSKMISAMNLFAILGDQILRVQKTGNQLDKPAENAQGRLSTIDNQNPDITSAQKMNRLPLSNTLAWSSYRSPFQMLLPSALVMPSSVAKNLNAGAGATIIPVLKGKLPYAEKKMNVVSTNSGRIDTDTREKFEATLESEYVPFYFHDLRTNEIISFHAFLQSLNENYSVNWENVEGIGRIDPVRIYKNTSRKLDFGFFIAATNRADFDVMWLKVNKLITMIYPQFSRGRTIFDGDSIDTSQNVIVQPFSQIVSAGPLIRLRIGDLIKSNYSKFNLARLFGFGAPELKIDGKSMKTEEKDADEIYSKMIRELQNVWTGASLPPKEYKFEIENGTTCTYVGDSPTDYARTWIVGGSDPLVMPDSNLLDCTIEEFKDDFAIVKISLKNTSDVPERDAISLNALKGTWSSSEFSSSHVVDGKYAVPLRSLTFTEKTAEKVKKDIAFGVTASVGDSLNNFMGDNNALVKSFKETGGKGLAGTLDSIGFHWIENVPWEITSGRTAPLICRVNMAFTPVHDISPGIDWQGNNRAPIYQIGSGYQNTGDK